MTAKEEDRLFELIQTNHKEVVEGFRLAAERDLAVAGRLSTLEANQITHKDCPTAKRLDKKEQDEKDNRLINAIKAGAKTIAAGFAAYLGIKYT